MDDSQTVKVNDTAGAITDMTALRGPAYYSSEEAVAAGDTGKDKKTGRFVPGNRYGVGKVKGCRNKMTQRMLDRVAARSEDGLSMEEIMMDIAQDPEMPAELRYKAAAKVSDLVYPRAASVEVNMEESDAMTAEQIDERLQQLLQMSMTRPA